MPSASLPTIAHVLHRLDRAGAELLAADLARGLSDRYRFLFFCLDDRGALGDTLLREGFDVVLLHRRPGLDWSCACRVRRAVARHRVHLLHAHQYTPFFYSALARCFPGRAAGLPILFTEHGRHYPDVRKWRRVIINRLLLRRDDRVTAVGRFVRDALVRNEGIPARGIGVIYNAPTPGSTPGSAPGSILGSTHENIAKGRVGGATSWWRARREARRMLGIDEHGRVVMQVARFHPVKDHATGLRAFAQVVRRVARAKLVLVGDGELRAACEALARELGVADRVVFTGVRGDVPALLPAADVFMLSSLSEGISVTLLEAMAAGLAICATDVGGNCEVVEHGRTGLLSPRGEPEPLAGHLTALLTDPHRRAAMGEAGRQRLHARFSRQQMHDAYATLYDAMLRPVFGEGGSAGR